MRRVLVVVLVLSQFAVLGYLAGQQEWIRRSGERIYLRTAPVDPRDPLRGDFVRLDYDINLLDQSHYRGNLAVSALSRGMTMFAVLKTGPLDVYQLDYLTDQQPDAGVFLRGRISRDISGGHIPVSYGIEQYFVEQGSGKLIEQKRGGVADVQVPMEVELAVSGSGRSVLIGYRWSRLGIRLEMDQQSLSLARDGDLQAPRSPQLTLSLHNVSDSPLQIADNAMHCGFSLQSLGDTSRRYRSADSRCNPFVLSESDIIELAPGEVYRSQFDMALPRWYVIAEGESGSASIAQAAANERFRLIYQAPVILPGMDTIAASLWQGALASPAFSARGRVD